MECVSALSWNPQEEPDESAKRGLAVTLGNIADKMLLDETIALMRNRKVGSTTILILPALTRTRDELAQAAVLELKDDRELRRQIAYVLKRNGKRAQKAS